ncbi:MAG: hypothetical protein Q8P24_19120 [Desulfobacterales bacterium]|nr:hypothetical protein [Desulfobacterales bacterium]
MLFLRKSCRCIILLLMAVFFSGTILLATIHSADASDRGKNHKKRFRDSRYHHDRYYPARGEIIGILPHGARVVVHGGAQYHFYGGTWYRPRQSRFVVITPPIGLMIPFLPPYYTMVRVGGTPYYYANDVYYTHSADGYVVVAPPQGQVSPVPPLTNQLFIYPRKDQNEKQQADDRYACHSWAVNQTDYDPTQPAGETPESDKKQKQADYNRAMGACLDARGYSVK